MSEERRAAMAAYGAELISVPPVLTWSICWSMNATKSNCSPAYMSKDRRAAMAAYGAELISVPPMRSCPLPA